MGVIGCFFQFFGHLEEVTTARETPRIHAPTALPFYMALLLVEDVEEALLSALHYFSQSADWSI